MASRIASASSRRSGNRASSRLSGSIRAAFGRTALDWRKTDEVKIRRWSALALQPEPHELGRPGTRADRDGVGTEPEYPRLSDVAARPLPKWCCQIRLANTRARSAAGREPGLVSHCARASRRPVEL